MSCEDCITEIKCCGNHFPDGACKGVCAKKTILLFCPKCHMKNLMKHSPERQRLHEIFELNTAKSA